MNTKFVLGQIQRVLDQWGINNFFFCGTSPSPSPGKIRLFVKGHTDNANDLVLAIEHLLKKDPDWKAVIQAALEPQPKEDISNG